MCAMDQDRVPEAVNSPGPRVSFEMAPALKWWMAVFHGGFLDDGEAPLARSRVGHFCFVFVTLPASHSRGERRLHLVPLTMPQHEFAKEATGFDALEIQQRGPPWRRSHRDSKRGREPNMLRVTCTLSFS